jgi:hypothetical protein
VEQREKEKLIVLLDYWIKHNTEHGDEFKEWADKVEDMGEEGVHDELVGAFQKMGEVNELLLKALEKMR